MLHGTYNFKLTEFVTPLPDRDIKFIISVVSSIEIKILTIDLLVLSWDTEQALNMPS